MAMETRQTNQKLLHIFNATGYAKRIDAPRRCSEVMIASERSRCLSLQRVPDSSKNSFDSREKFMERLVTNTDAHNRLTKIADDIWLVDPDTIDAAGLPLPVRMVVIRLANGDLLLHSPTRYSDLLRQQLEELGRIRYFLAPNIAHWIFLPGWQSALPDVELMAVTGLKQRAQVRRSGLRIDTELNGEIPAAWAGQLDTVLLAAPPFAELAVFHRPSRTLLLTDLVQNLEPERLPPLPRLFAKAFGITAPDGRAPIYLRILMRLWGSSPAQAAARLVRLDPARVVFSHGDWFNDNASARLRHSLRWLLPDASSHGAQSHEMRGRRIVITGASSGIGRATALIFAKHGASLVLAARRDDVLREVAKECAKLGGVALVVPTDVTDPEAVTDLARQAEETFGGIDVWINNAGTGVFGPYHQAELALHRKTIEVNLLGTMNGAYAALPVFRRQRRGILINNISLGGWAPTPFAAAYTASKFGLRGFTASLRQELSQYPHIHVCAVFPSMIDTPGFVHAANVSGRYLDPGPLLYRPEEVAETFVSVVRRPRDEVAVGWPARAGQLSYAALRGPTERGMAAVVHFLLARANKAPVSAGSILQSVPEGVAADGGWLATKQLPSASALTKIGLGAGLAVLAWTMVRSARRQNGRLFASAEHWNSIARSPHTDRAR
jgi:short-subunit dehydrogenase